MKVKITMDRNASSSWKESALSRIMRDLGSKVTVSGDVVVVEDGRDERDVVDILN